MQIVQKDHYNPMIINFRTVILKLDLDIFPMFTVIITITIVITITLITVL